MTARAFHDELVRKPRRGSSRRAARATPFQVKTRGGTAAPLRTAGTAHTRRSPAARSRAASGDAASAAASVVTSRPRLIRRRRPDAPADSGVVRRLMVQQREDDSGVLRRDPGAARVAVDGRGEPAVRAAPPPRRPRRRAIAPLVAVHHHDEPVAPANPAERAHVVSVDRLARGRGRRRPSHRCRTPAPG